MMVLGLGVVWSAFGASGSDVPMVVSPDSVIVRPVCDVKDKTVRGLYLNPVGWVGIFFESLWWRISR